MYLIQLEVGDIVCFPYHSMMLQKIASVTEIDNRGHVYTEGNVISVHIDHVQIVCKKDSRMDIGSEPADSMIFVQTGKTMHEKLAEQMIRDSKTHHGY